MKLADLIDLLPQLPPRLNKHLDVFREGLRRRRIQAPMACIPSQTWYMYAAANRTP
jgi:hypothetical protein